MMVEYPMVYLSYSPCPICWRETQWKSNGSAHEDLQHTLPRPKGPCINKFGVHEAESRAPTNKQTNKHNTYPTNERLKITTTYLLSFSFFWASNSGPPTEKESIVNDTLSLERTVSYISWFKKRMSAMMGYSQSFLIDWIQAIPSYSTAYVDGQLRGWSCFPSLSSFEPAVEDHGRV